MVNRLFAAFSLLLLAVTFSACTSCGWIWEDFRKPQSCRSDWEPKK